MLLTKASLQALMTSFSMTFRQAWGETPNWHQHITTQIPSNTRINTYGWMARLLAMRKWAGPRVIQNLNTHAYTLENDPYETTVGVDKHDFADDNLGVYSPLISEMGRVGRKWPDQLSKRALQAGITNLGFDSAPFFSASHPLNPAGVQSNLFEPTGAVTGPSPSNWDQVRSAMVSYTGEDGEPLGIMPNTLIVPPTLELQAKTTLTAAYGSAGATNVQQGQANVIVIPELANEPNVWYAAQTTGAIKPLIFQLREAISLVTKTLPTDDNVFQLRQFLWGLEGRGAVGYGPWFLMARVDPDDANGTDLIPDPVPAE
jgi:phage major head subunit gpT-like protein